MSGGVEEEEKLDQDGRHRLQGNWSVRSQHDGGVEVITHTDLRGVSGTWRSSWFHFGASSPAVLTAELRLGEMGRATARLSCLGGKEKA